MVGRSSSSNGSPPTGSRLRAGGDGVLGASYLLRTKGGVYALVVMIALGWMILG